ncbi:MAG TPA: slipin family protein [Acetobacteraceae bacterium]|nr:slipin family protein [Acetobacteraceae bacterium]
MRIPLLAFLAAAVLVAIAAASVKAGIGVAPAVVLLIAAVCIVSATRMANQWERVVVQRFGRLRSMAGPGLFFLVPFVDTATIYVDQRIRTSEIVAEKALTRDTVSVDVDAIVFWQVRDAQRAALEIANYHTAVERVAQTSMREMIGASVLTRLLSDRQAADAALKQVIGAKTSAWGIEVVSVEIKDVAIPPELNDAMSRQAQAEREKSARVTLAEAEVEIAQRVAEAAAVYDQHPIALKLRQMGLLYDMNKDKGATILVPTDMVYSLGSSVLGSAMAKGDRT